MQYLTVSILNSTLSIQSDISLYQFHMDGYTQRYPSEIYFCNEYFLQLCSKLEEIECNSSITLFQPATERTLPSFTFSKKG